MKRIITVLLVIAMLVGLFSFSVSASEQAVVDLDCPSAILIERSSGEVLYTKDADTPRPMASVTKIMTLLLIMEAIEAEKITQEETVTSSAHAVSMGGSQIYLKEGESLTVTEMLKAITIASANDAAVAMAEHIAGSDTAFVAQMNKRAKELGMKNTHFVNCTGLDADGHHSSARDIAKMSVALLSHDKIKEYTTVWMDSLRGGQFGLTNTNKLVRFYEGCTGLKTGSTSKALYCMAASAERNGMELIAVVLGSSSSQKRFEDAKKLLNFGFAGFELYRTELTIPETVYISGTVDKLGKIECPKAISLLVGKGMAGEITPQVNLKENLAAPLKKGDNVGSVDLLHGEEILHKISIVLSEDVKKATYFDIFLQIIRVFLTV